MSKFARHLERRDRQKRVVIQRPEGAPSAPVDQPLRRARARGDELAEWARSAELAEWVRVERRALKSQMKVHPVVRLTEHGVDWGAAPRPGDEIGYGMEPLRTDDCLQTAIATATQIPIEEVPDLQLDRRLRRGEDVDVISRTSWERIARWASERGLTAMFWAEDELPVPRDRWIGVAVVGAVSTVKFNDHCLVMCHGELVFDPSCSVKVPPGVQRQFCTLNQITYGISFDKEE
jgi:hypothetical protein